MYITGSLQIKSNHYYVVYRIDGGKVKWKATKIPVGRNRSERGQNKRLAEEFKNRFFADLEKYEDDDSSQKSILFNEYLLFWVDEHKEKVKESTWIEYNRGVRSCIEPYFKKHNKYLVEIIPKDLEHFLVYLRDEKKLSKKSVSNYKSILSKAMRYAYVNDMIDKNPADKVELPLFDEGVGYEPIIYTPEQMRTLLEETENADSQTKLFIYLTSVTGARKGEILGLTWDNVDFESNIIHLKQSMTQNSKKSSEKLSTLKTKNSYRSCYLPEKVMIMLKDEKEKQENFKDLLGDEYTEYKYDFVIRQDNGKIYNCPQYMNRKVNRVMDKAGLPHCRIHDFRHFVATLLFDNNVPINQITAQLGHGDTTTTERIYVHRYTIANKENARLIESAII